MGLAKYIEYHMDIIKFGLLNIIMMNVTTHDNNHNIDNIAEID